MSSLSPSMYPSLLRYRLAVASRTAAAVFGGYALSAAFAAAFSVWLPRVSSLSRTDAVMAATMLSFIVYAAAVVWVFSCTRAGRAWFGLLAPALILGALAWATGPAVLSGALP